jgi:hypothetical protein
VVVQSGNATEPCARHARPARHRRGAAASLGPRVRLAQPQLLLLGLRRGRGHLPAKTHTHSHMHREEELRARLQRVGTQIPSAHGVSTLHAGCKGRPGGGGVWWWWGGGGADPEKLGGGAGEARVQRDGVGRVRGRRGELHTWEKQALSAMRFKRVGRHSEYAI